jgi:hypothetical protein
MVKNAMKICPFCLQQIRAIHRTQFSKDGKEFHNRCYNAIILKEMNQVPLAKGLH